MNTIKPTALLNMIGRTSLGHRLSAVMATPARPVLAASPAYEASEATALFNQAVADNSNLEMDWLWLATQVGRDNEQRYSLERALHINPHSEPARRMLATLPPSAPAVEGVPTLAGNPCV
jgi:hypothetical protein